MSNSKSEWFLFDLRQLTYGLYEVKFSNQVHYYSNWAVKKEDIIKSISQRGFTIDYIKLVSIENVIDLDRYLKNFCDYIKNRYGDHIIMLQVKESFYYMDEQGNVSYKPDISAERSIQLMNLYWTKIINYIHCHYILMPSNIIWDYYNKWGDTHRVHYIQEYYDYANKCIEIITSRSTTNKYKELYQLLSEYSILFDNIRNGFNYSRVNIVGQYLSKFKQNVIDCDLLIKEIIERLNNVEDPLLQSNLYGIIGKIYRDRQDNKSSLCKSLEWYKKCKPEDEYNRLEYCDTLILDGGAHTGIELISVLYDLSLRDNATAMYRLGKLFFNGKFVKTNKDEAMYWIGLSAKKGNSKAKTEYYDLLLKIGTNESYTKMIDYAMKEANRGNLELMARLGRAYRDGKGVEKSLETAAHYLRICYKNNKPCWSAWELFDILIQINTTESIQEALFIATDGSSRDNYELINRLGLMYKEGVGVEKDLSKSEEYYKKAYELQHTKSG